MARQGEGYSYDDEQEASGWVPNWAHTGLDYLGMIPGYGAAADLLNAGLYLTEGDLGNAGLSGVAAIPGAGDWAGLGKIGRNLVTGGARVFRSGRGAGDVNEQLQEHGVNPILASVLSSAGMGSMSALGKQPFTAGNFLRNTYREGAQDFTQGTVLSALRQKIPQMDNFMDSWGWADPWQSEKPMPSTPDMPSIYSEPNYGPVQRRLEQGSYWNA